MAFTLLRVFLAITGFGFLSILFIVRSHHELDRFRNNQKMMILSGFRAGPYGSVESIVPTPVVNTNSSDAYPIVHIVYTRFMQHQPDLTSLGLARLELLKAFFLTSLQGQTIDNFLVIVRTDPELNSVMKEQLLEIFPNTTENKYKFRYIVLGTNDNNPKSRQYDDVLRRLSEGVEVWGGSADEAQRYLQEGAASGQLILETRLDSDDALHRSYIETLQNQARRDLLPDIRHMHDLTVRNITGEAERKMTIGSWKIWCAGKYLEWQYNAPWGLKRAKQVSRLRDYVSSHSKDRDGSEEEEGTNDDEETDDNEKDDNTFGENTHDGEIDGLGALISLKFSGCVSAGLSLAYIPFQNNKRIPALQKHESLADDLPKCRGSKGKKPAVRTNCLSFMTLNPSVLRARTPTSAGMLNILWDWDAKGSAGAAALNEDNVDDSKGTNQNPRVAMTLPLVETSALYRTYQNGAIRQQPYQAKFWRVVDFVFGLTPGRIRDLREYLENNMIAIAKDNLDGQCSAGHSCKNSSQAMLRSIVLTN